MAFNGTLNIAFQSGFNTNGWVTIFDFDTYSGNFTATNFSGLASGYTASFDELSGTLAVIPEPTTWALLAGSLAATIIFRRRRALH